MSLSSLRPIRQLCMRSIQVASHSPFSCRHFITTPTLRALGGSRLLSHPEPRTPTPFLPRFLQPSTLKALIPPFTRRKDAKKTEWNPYTFFIAAFLIIGSQAINIIALQKEHADFMRKAEAKIDLLREVIERIQRGEDVDVEKVLGTGVEAEEKSWEELLKEIEEEDVAFNSKKAKRAGNKQEDEAERDNFTTMEEERVKTAMAAPSTARMTVKKVTAADYFK